MSAELPRVGQRVYDRERGESAIVTDIRRKDRERPEYVLRPPYGMGGQWTTEDPARLRPAAER